MTNIEFVEQLAMLLCLDSAPTDIQIRSLRINITRDPMGMPESITIDFARPESVFRIVMGNPVIDPEIRSLWINAIAVQQGRAKVQACALIEAFLQQLSLLPRSEEYGLTEASPQHLSTLALNA